MLKSEIHAQRLAKEPSGLSLQATALVHEAWSAGIITDWGADSGFDQNRVFVGLGFKFKSDSPVRIETGYLNQYAGRAGGDDLSNHLVVNLYWSP